MSKIQVLSDFPELYRGNKEFFNLCVAWDPQHLYKHNSHIYTYGKKWMVVLKEWEHLRLDEGKYPFFLSKAKQPAALVPRSLKAAIRKLLPSQPNLPHGFMFELSACKISCTNYTLKINNPGYDSKKAREEVYKQIPPLRDEFSAWTHVPELDRLIQYFRGEGFFVGAKREGGIEPYWAIQVYGHGIRGGLVSPGTEETYRHLEDRLTVDNIRCFDKWSKCPLSIPISQLTDKNLPSVLQEIKYLGSEDGFRDSDGYDYEVKFINHMETLLEDEENEDELLQKDPS